MKYGPARVKPLVIGALLASVSACAAPVPSEDVAAETRAACERFLINALSLESITIEPETERLSGSDSQPLLTGILTGFDREGSLVPPSPFVCRLRQAPEGLQPREVRLGVVE